MAAVLTSSELSLSLTFAMASGSRQAAASGAGSACCWTAVRRPSAAETCSSQGQTTAGTRHSAACLSTRLQERRQSCMCARTHARHALHRHSGSEGRLCACRFPAAACMRVMCTPHLRFAVQLLERRQQVVPDCIPTCTPLALEQAWQPVSSNRAVGQSS
jgi:hypothetical protein